MYLKIFTDNVLNTLRDRNMTRADLSKISGVSNSYLTDLSYDSPKPFNPSLKTMQAIAFALDVHLSYLLDPTNLDQEQFKNHCETLAKDKQDTDLVYITLSLPPKKALEVQKMAYIEKAKRQIKG